MIKFIEGRYFVGMWYLEIFPCSIAPKGGDFMSCIWREEGNITAPWVLQYRHRYYCGEPHNEETLRKSGDRFSWYQGEIPSTEQESSIIERHTAFLDSVAEIARSLGNPHEPEVFMIQGDLEKFLELVDSDKRPPWLHSTRVDVSKEGGE